MSGVDWQPPVFDPGFPGEFRINPERNRMWGERRQAAQLRKGEILAAIESMQEYETVAGPVLRHHSPDEDRRYCEGCDLGCSCEAASWPCSTVELIRELAGVDTTDIGLIDWKGEL